MPIILTGDVSDFTADDSVVKLKKMNMNLFRIMKIQHDAMFDYVWHNPDHSAKDILGRFENEAYILFQVSSQIQTILATIDPNYTPRVPPKQYTINQDGTVTIQD